MTFPRLIVSMLRPLTFTLGMLTMLSTDCGGLISVTAHADNWPQWRGTESDGISHEGSIATVWSPTKNVAWRTPMPGPAGATPVVWGDRLFVTSADASDNLELICLDTKTGRKLWQRQVSTGNRPARGEEGNSASPSPVTDGEHVWVFFSTGDLACFDFEGNERWKFDVEDRFGAFDIQFGMTSTPVLHEDALYLQLIHGPMRRDDDRQTGQVIKLDKLTGETIWEHDRKTDVVFECKHSYASPFLYNDGERKFLVVHGADCTTGHSLETGEELWRFGGLNGGSAVNRSQFDPTFRFVASPAVTNGKIIIPTAKNGPTVAINVNDALKGDVTEKEQVIAWVLPETPDVSIPLVVDGLVYLLHKDGRLQCVELESGKELYFERTHNAVQHRASPTYADGHIYLCARDGMCTVIKAGPQFKIVAQNQLDDSAITASPIVADGTLYLRSFDALYAIRK